jgi:hypothetical protein
MNSLALSDDAVVLGFDPGGGRSFGAAVLSRSEFAATTVGCVRDALAWAIERCGDQVPVAAGIDARLHWSDEPSGWRPADRALRAAYPRVRSSVVSPNGLFGSMTVGGMALAFRLRERWPDLVLNETHPKVLHSALTGQHDRPEQAQSATDWFVDLARLTGDPLQNAHELDAVISAWATQTGLLQGWPDLVGNNEHLVFPLGKVRFLWPEALVEPRPG